MTPRRIFIGILAVALAIGHTCWTVYEETIWQHFGTAFTASMLFQSVVGVLVVLVLWNRWVGSRRPGWALSSGELAVIYVLVTLSAVPAGLDQLQYLMPFVLYPFWQGNDTNHWESFQNQMPKAWYPRSMDAIHSYLYGNQNIIATGEWRYWVQPCLYWGGFLFVLLATLLCIGTIFRRHWVDHEKLSFPVVTLPVMLIKDRGLGDLLRNPLLLIGAGLTSAVMSCNVLHGLFPAVPCFQLNIYNISNGIQTPPWNCVAPVFVNLEPYALGLCFLVPLDIGFSCWFFYIAIRLSMVVATAHGLRDPTGGIWAPDVFPFIRQQSYGAWAGLVFMVLWSARRHLKWVFSSVFTGRKMDDENEPLSYKTAVIGLGLGLAYLYSCSVWAGMSWWVSGLYWTIFFLASAAMTRIFAQIASPMLEFYFFSADAFFVNMVGSGNFSTKSLTVISNYYWFNRCYRQQAMGHELESFWIADNAGVKRRLMTKVIVGAFAIGIVCGLVTLTLAFTSYGGASAKVAGSAFSTGAEPWGRLTTWILMPGPTTTTRWAALFSLGMVVVLSVARNAFIGFPLNPIAWVLAVSYSLEYWWSTFLLTWIIKSLVVRYGGLRLYRRVLPFFLGLIIGDCITQLFWGLVMAILGLHGRSPYLEIVWF